MAGGRQDLQLWQEPLLRIKAVSASTYLLVEDDRGYIIEFSNACVVTGPALSTGFAVTLVKKGTGDVQFTPDVGLSLEAVSDTLTVQYSYATIHYKGSNIWGASGAFSSGGGGIINSATEDEITKATVTGDITGTGLFNTVAGQISTPGAMKISIAGDTGASGKVLSSDGAGNVVWATGGGGGGVSDGDKGDITVSSSGTVWTVDADITKAWAGVHSFQNTKLTLFNPANTFNYSITTSAIAANRTLTLPLITTNDTFTLDGFASTFTATKSFNSGTFSLFNPANTFKYNYLGSAIAADRTVTLPLLAANDTFVTEAFATTLTNKTLGAGTVFSVVPTINSGIKFTFSPSGTTAGLNAGSNAGAPSGLSNFDIWGDSTNLDFYGRINGATTALSRQIWEDVSTTTYTFVEADRNKVKRFTHASGCTATIPTGLSAYWQTTLWRDNAAGVVTIASSGTLESTGTTMDTVKTFATVLHRGSDIHSVGGAVGSGAAIVAPLTVTTSSTLTTANNRIYNVFVDATSGNIVITLPDGNSSTVHNIKRIDSTANTVTFTGTIDGNSAYLGTNGLLPLNAFTLVYNGTNFYAI